jgi:hypothetical protein
MIVTVNKFSVLLQCSYHWPRILLIAFISIVLDATHTPHLEVLHFDIGRVKILVNRSSNEISLDVFAVYQSHFGAADE